MRSARGKCPQCREIIVVDLDAPELRCPYCNALLRKSAKAPTPARTEQKAEQQETIRQHVPTAEPTPIPSTPIANEAVAAEVPASESVAEAKEGLPAEQPVEETVAAPAEEPVKEEPAAADTQESSAGEVAPPDSDEIGISDEELAMMDEAPLSDEALSANQDTEPLDESPAEEPQPTEDVSEETPAPNEDVEAESSVAKEPVIEEVPAETEEPVTVEAPADTAEEVVSGDTPATEQEPAAEEDAAVDQQAGEMAQGPVSDETLLTDEAPAEQSVLTEDEPFVSGSIDAEAEDEGEEDAAEQEGTDASDSDAEVPAEQDAPINNNVTLEDDFDPALLDEDVAAFDDQPAFDNNYVSKAPVADLPSDDAPSSDPLSEAVVDQGDAEAIPSLSAEGLSDEGMREDQAEDAPAEEVSPDDQTEDPLPEERETSLQASEETTDIPAPQKEKEDAEEYVPSEEDMAFAASLSETGRKGKGAFIPSAPRVTKPAQPEAEEPEKPKKAKKEKKQEKESKKKEKQAEREGKKSAPKGETSMGDTIYKKPIAIAMAVLSVLAAVFYFLYVRIGVIGLISLDLELKLLETLPHFGEEKFGVYVVVIFGALIAAVSALGLTGKKCKLGFLFVLAADLAYVAFTLFGNADSAAIADSEAIVDIVSKYAEYVQYIVFGLLLVAAVFFALSLTSARDDYDISGSGAILPILYLALVVVGYVVLILLPKLSEDFALSADLLKAVILGAIGVSVLLTFVGVHKATASRSANGWLIFATLLTIVLVNILPVIMEKIMASGDVAMDFHEEIPLALTPIIAIFGVIGFTVADLRN